MGLENTLLDRRTFIQSIGGAVLTAAELLGQDQKQGQQPKKLDKQATKKYIEGLLKESGILEYTKDWYDYDDPDSRRKLEKRVKELIKSKDVDETDLSYLDSEPARQSGIGGYARGPPLTKKDGLFILVYSGTILAYPNDEAKCLLDLQKTSFASATTLSVFGKELPRGRGISSIYWDGAMILEARYAQLSNILNGTRKVNKSMEDEVKKEYLRAYFTCQNDAAVSPMVMGEFLENVVLATVNSGMEKIGYRHVLDDNLKYKLEKIDIGSGNKSVPNK
jgi:hypothetical protein